MVFIHQEPTFRLQQGTSSWIRSVSEAYAFISLGLISVHNPTHSHSKQLCRTASSTVSCKGGGNSPKVFLSSGPPHRGFQLAF